MKPLAVEGPDLTSLFFIVPLILTCAIGVWLPSIYAENIGIILDNTCIRMIQNNVSSTCPTYEDIITIYPDKSYRDVSGDFGYTKGFYHRLPTKLINSFNYYNSSDVTIILIDPPATYYPKIKLIEIRANLDSYLLRGNQTHMYNGTEHSVTLWHGRYIDSCRLAYIDSTNWSYLLGDTIYHLQQNCSPSSTTFVSKTTTPLEKIKHDIRTSYAYKLKEWQKESLLKCGTKICLYERNQTSPP